MHLRVIETLLYACILPSCSESADSNKEYIEESKTTIENLEQTKSGLLSQVEALKSDLASREDALTSLMHTKETMTQMIQVKHTIKHWTRTND